ncbi:MAG: tetraacyldisaccharide 4'-kinase [Rhodospirillales bacterium]
MRAPDFWRHHGLLANLLAPAACLYALGAARRQRLAQPQELPVPLICVGNPVAGGAGKTPVALSLAGRLIAQGRRPVFLTRGYGGGRAGPTTVDPAQHDAEAVGDEPLLLAALAPTVVARDRPAGAQAALAAGAEVIVMDDGFQNPSLRKDLSLLVVDAAYGLGNRRVLPAGPLREPLSAALARADALVPLRGEEPVGDLGALGDLPQLGARLRPGRGGLAGRRLLAFAGIGRPEKFFATLESLGAILVARLAFADHRRYRPRELADLRRRAAALEADLITTEKDLMRLSPPDRQGIETLPVTVVWDDPEAVDRLLQTLWEEPRRG